jgi:hypothetical protein
MSIVRKLRCAVSFRNLHTVANDCAAFNRRFEKELAMQRHLLSDTVRNQLRMPLYDTVSEKTMRKKDYLPGC